MNRTDYSKLPHKALTTKLNKFMEGNRDAETNAIFSYVIDESLVPSDSRIQPGAWALSTTMLAGIKEGQICIAAHVTKPKRVFGILTQSRGRRARGVPSTLQYEFIKLEPRPTGRHNGVKRLRVTRAKDENGLENGTKLITTKRGWHAIHVPTMKYQATKGADGKFRIKPEDEAALSQMYEKYIHGMDHVAPKSLSRKAQDHGKEQFLLEEYPTPEWREAVLNRKRGRGDDSESEEDRPTVFMPGYDDNMQKIPDFSIDRRDREFLEYKKSEESENAKLQQRSCDLAAAALLQLMQQV